MATSVELEDGVTAEWMFGLLGYSTWNLYRGREFLGQVTLNAVDRTAVFTVGADTPWVADSFLLRSWSWWMRWLRRHRHEPF